MGMAIISPILPQYAQVFGVSITMVGLVITVFGVARLIADIPAGRLSTKFGCRPVLISGPIIICIGSIGCGLAGNYATLLAFRFIMGIGSAVLTTTSMIALIHMSTSQNRGQMMGFYQGCFLIGAGLGPAIGGFIAEYMGIRAPFYVYAGLAASATIWGYYRLPKNLDIMKPEKPKQQVNPDDQPGGSVVSKMGIKSLLKDLNFVLISTITFGIFFMRNGSQNQILPLIGNIRLNLSEGQIGLAMTVMTVSQAIIIFTCSRLSDRFGRKAIIILGCIIVSISLIVMAMSSNYLLLILSSILGGIGVGISGPAPAAYVADIIPRENYGVGMGLFRAVGDLGMVIGPVLLGWMSDTWSFNVALIFNCIFLLFTVAIFRIFAKAPIVKSPAPIESVD
jgi:MFS family permease